jgi:multimeric flavodoxin WrbA
MRVLGICCSPRKGGNTEILVREALEAVRENGGETELILVADMNIAPCDGCGACRESGICKIDDDMQMIYKQLELSDGVILGTPSYFVNVSAQAKTVMDRTYAFLMSRKLRGKVAAALVAARRLGAAQILGLLYTFFSVHRMVIAGGGVGYGLEKGDVKQGVGGSPFLSAIEEARSVGKNVVRMINQLSTDKS